MISNELFKIATREPVTPVWDDTLYIAVNDQGCVKLIASGPGPQRPSFDDFDVEDLEVNEAKFPPGVYLCRWDWEDQGADWETGIHSGAFRDYCSA